MRVALQHRPVTRLGSLLLGVIMSRRGLRNLVAVEARGEAHPRPGRPAVVLLGAPTAAQDWSRDAHEVRARRGLGRDGTVYRVMYLSESVIEQTRAGHRHRHRPRSLRAAPAGYPVVTWGHGTNGMADQCAPSLDPASDVPLTNDLLDQGWEVTASDYQGEGTPGLLPYLVGVSAARNTVDIVRAARHLAAAHASANYVVWGHSEGGQTAMFAAPHRSELRARPPSEGRRGGCPTVAVLRHLPIPADEPVPLLPVHGGRRVQRRVRGRGRSAQRGPHARRGSSSCPISTRGARITSPR